MDYGENQFIINRIKVYGIVQGVGFRPLVYHIAKRHGICGYVRNVGGYAEILAQGTKTGYDSFLEELLHDSSSGCEIMKYEAEELCKDNQNQEWYSDFVILSSGHSEEVSVLVPDLSLCENCRKELIEISDRRYLNPFISCTACGPRYTILEELPYDRDNTVMKDFTMCEACKSEYQSSENRRYHAQTISCYDCGPYLIYQSMENSNRYEISRENMRKLSGRASDHEALCRAAEVIKAGGILAVKGIGGYHFVCSPYREESVKQLRNLKGREEKPFAVMFPTTASIKEFCEVSKVEQDLLESKARPIVLLRMKRGNLILAPSVTKGSIYCGSFLPYTPLQFLLIRECGPLIMTSGNLSGRPIIREDEDIFSIDSPLLNGSLYHKRRIVRSVDDSVARIIDGKPQLIRRSRGYVPYPIFLNTGEAVRPGVVLEPVLKNQKKKDNNCMVFAAGADLKAAYCLYNKGAAVVSQYFGDLEEEAVLREYLASFRDMKRLLKIEPDLATCDLHPNYYSTRLTREMGLPVVPVQHHHAHIASVMAEHELTGPVLGVAFDGTGYGEDGNIWGGEFLLCREAEYKRVAMLRYTKVLGGDSSMRDAKKTAACYLIDAGLSEYVQDERLPVIRAAIEHHVNTVLTSSMGRLFDAAAAILGLGQENHYEGECAAALEREAVNALCSQTEPVQLFFSLEEKHEIIEVDSRPLLKELCIRREEGIPSLALGFHYAVTDMIQEVCRLQRKRNAINRIALSGGVFQNSILAERTVRMLRKDGFCVYYNMAVPPNDGGISLGQTYIALRKQGNLVNERFGKSDVCCGTRKDC